MVRRRVYREASSGQPLGPDEKERFIYGGYCDHRQVRRVMREGMREDTRGRVGGGTTGNGVLEVLKHGARSGQRGLRVLQMELKSGCVPCVLWGHDLYG
jgi:hypothetical protein